MCGKALEASTACAASGLADLASSRKLSPVSRVTTTCQEVRWPQIRFWWNATGLCRPRSTSPSRARLMRRLCQDVPVTNPDTARCSNICTARCGRPDR